MDEPVGVVVVGYGYWGANLARNVLASDHTTLIGVVEPDRVGRAKAERTFPGLATWDALDGALADTAVEAVVLSTPAATHHPLALQALHAGRHVLVEKPLALRLEDANDLIDLAASDSLTLMVGHTFLYSAAVQRLKRIIDDGQLGTVQYLSSQRLSLGRIRRDCDALWNFAPHDVSIICHLMGGGPVEVSATGFDFVQPGIADVCFATMRFPGGEGAGLHVSWIDPRKTRLLTVVGDAQMALYNDVSPDQKLWIVDAGVAREQTFGEYESMGEYQVKTRAGDIVIPQLPYREPLLVEIDVFGRACRGGETPVTDGRHGAITVAVLQAMSQSMDMHGAPVAVGS